MRIKDIDHIVITTSDLQACLDFYVGLLGMEHRETNRESSESHQTCLNQRSLSERSEGESNGRVVNEEDEVNGHHNLYFPNGKISIHTRKGEFQPVAEHPTYGSQDFCLIVDGDLQDVKAELEAKQVPIISDIVVRHGAHGEMHSLYLRDPDGQLTEQREQSHACMSFAES